jgi:hypothetical protein
MSTLAHPHQAAVAHWLRHSAWFAFASAVAFLVPFVGVSVLDFQHDLYYLVYFATTAVLLVIYVRAEDVDFRRIVIHAWPWSLALGFVIGLAMVQNVLGEEATVRPSGAYFVFELLWRGVAYGAVDALLLSAFPGLIAYSILRGRVDGFLGKLRFTALALPLILVITAAYHLGYPQYREDGIAKPETGNTIISVPMLATANPIGSVVAHASMHVTAVAHAYETPTFLPPETKAGIAATQTRSLASFTGVELAGSNNVSVHVGEKQSVVVHADENLLGRVTTVVEDGLLVIGNTSGTFTTEKPMRVVVSVPSLDTLRLTGSGVVSVAGVTSSSLTLTLAGSGVLRAGGTATRLEVTLDGSGEVQAGQVVARDVQAVVSGSGRVLITATKSLEASVPGSGAIVYSGNPAVVRTSITGSGAVTRG